MSNASGTIQSVAIELSKLLRPLQRDLATTGQAKAFFAKLGFTLTNNQVAALAAPLATTASRTADLLTIVSALVTAIATDNTGAIAAQGVKAIQKIAEVINGISSVGTQLGGVVGLPAAQVSQRIFDYLLFSYLDSAEGLNEILELLGLLDREDHNEDSLDPDNPPFTIATYHFNQISDWFADPSGQLATLFDWGENGFNGAKLFSKLEAILADNGLPVIYDAGGPVPRLDLVFLEILPKTDVSPPGLLIRLRSAFGTGTQTIDLGTDAKLELKLDVQPPSETTLALLPDGTIQLTPPGPGPSFSGDALLKLIARRTAPPEPFLLFGAAGGSRIELGEFNFTTGVKLAWSGGSAQGDFLIGAAANDLKVIIDTSKSDGFLSKILPGTRIESEFDLELGVAGDTGFYFKGSSDLEVQLPLHLAIGPIALEALTIAARLEGGKIPISVGADLRASLGPLVAVVENMGVMTTLSFPAGNKGNLGPVQFDLGFKPPNGVGLSIDTGAVRGGGYLFFDFAKEEYAGVLELSLLNIVTVKAIGLITTRLPDGSKGFSLLIIISAEFTPIQLGFGFTLNGVGGLLGLNRTVLLDALRDGVRTGAINSVMFPSNIIQNAPKIISDLRTIFPPFANRFLIGPMAKFGWGTPSLITLTFGLIIEIPGNIAILGVLKIVLPDEAAALILLQVNFVGTLDFDKKMLTFDASLFDSRVLFITLEGDMAVRLKWGDNPAFLLTVGGFHPQFDPPPLSLPALRRIAANILNYSWARIRIEGYYAVTSNTVQFGSRAELFFGLDSVNVSGHIGYDVLFQFSPFYFIAQISGSLSLEVFGFDVLSIRLKLALEGPSPWRAKGTGSISILFWDIDVDFDVTWGEEKNTSLPPIAVMPLLSSELQKRDSWQARPPTANNLLVSLRQLDAELLVLHPVGSLTVQQRFVPLAKVLDKVGAQKPSDVNKIEITSVTSGATSLSITTITDSFAPAQFEQMSDAEKLSRQSYQPMPAGVTIAMSGAGLQTSKMVRRTIAYEITVIDKEPVKPLLFGVFFKALGGLFFSFLKGAAVAQSPLSHHYKTQLQPVVPAKIAVQPEGFTVAFNDTNAPLSVGAVFNSESLAIDHMKQQISVNPKLKNALHVIPNYEVSA